MGHALRGVLFPVALPVATAANSADNVLLIDRDDRNHVRVWHSAGATNLSDEQITDIFMSALPGGGRRITVGEYHVKAFITKLGVTATLWRAPVKQ